jgi:3-oxoacyl-[acyl-carrier protein] reductase
MSSRCHAANRLEGNAMNTTTNSLPLAGKVALVTGGSRSIGAAIAKRLAADGAAVALTYSASAASAEALVHAIEQAGGAALAVRADAADVAAVRAAVAKTVEVFGRLDILVNNAGIGLIKPVGEFTLEDFDRIVAVNVKGVFVATQEALRHMRDGGRIVNIGSINSDYVPYDGATLYVLTKGAVAGLTRALGRELGPRGITVNNVMPGPVDTDMNPADGAFADHARQLIAMKRYGTADEIADLVAYLASPGASYITGASMAIDGGYSA